MTRTPVRRRKPKHKAPQRASRMTFWAIANDLYPNSTDADFESALDDQRGCPFDDIEEARQFVSEMNGGTGA